LKARQGQISTRAIGSPREFAATRRFRRLRTVAGIDGPVLTGADL
jgi:hypothetical protein